MGTVHHIRPGLMFAPGPLFEKAWMAFPESGKRRSSRRLSGVAWARAALYAGEAKLLAAVLRYVNDDPDLDGFAGAPGFHRWLNDDRWEYWIVDAPHP